MGFVMNVLQKFSKSSKIAFELQCLEYMLGHCHVGQLAQISYQMHSFLSCVSQHCQLAEKHMSPRGQGHLKENGI